MSRHTTIECEADVDIFELAEELSDDKKLELAEQLLADAGKGFARGSGRTIHEQALLIGRAVERCEEAATRELLRQLHIESLQVPA